MSEPLDLVSVGMRVTDLEFAIEKLRGAVISDAVRLNAHAEDITDHARRLETLEIEQAGNDRTFRELISDNAELANRIEKLEEGVSLLETIMELHSQRLPDLSFLIARHSRITKPAAQERNELTGWLVALQERVSKLERLLERED